LIGSPEPPLHPPYPGDGSWRRKTTNETGDFPRAFLSQQQKRLGRSKKHGSAQSNANSRGELQDLLIDRFVEHRQAVAEGQEERVKAAEAEIDSLLRE
jgi:hypothetical protein